ncbi:MAG: hypothetical protein EA370_00745 [Wenzhouxiangella sp.]|nr:MAG: hypothetical protein EA370_00745 [Wenzhouxiangella sp.]
MSETVSGGTRIIRGYYLATPVFLLLDVVLGLDLRVAFLDNSGARMAWYALCTGLGVVAWRWPVSAPLIGLLESAVSFFLLIVWIMLPIMLPTDDFSNWPGPWGILPFILIGSACIISFHSANRALMKQLSR